MRILKVLKFKLVKVPIVTFIMLSLLVFETASANDIIFSKKQLILNGEDYLLEIARSTKQRRHGLMYRGHLDKRQGMLFIYPGSGDHRIWMKNTLIPLTVIWLDKNEKIIGIKKLPPCVSDPCPSYGVSKPSKYVLELDSGSHSLKPGQSIKGIIQLE
jgi:uncharacterized membrane protein (UPF0127 family)